MISSKKLQSLLKQATYKTLDAFHHDYGDEHIYILSLFTSGDYRYVVDSISTTEGLKRVAQKYLTYPNFQDWGEINTAMEKLKWSQPDSPHHIRYQYFFDDANELIETFWEETPETDDDYMKTCQLIHESCELVLRDVRDKDLVADDVVLNILMGDQSDEERYINAERINRPDVLRQYRKELVIDEVRLEYLRRTYWSWND